MDHRTIVSFFTCQLVWVNRYLVRGHSWFETCPECNHAPPEQAPATLVDLTIAKLKDVIRK